MKKRKQKIKAVESESLSLNSTAVERDERYSMMTEAEIRADMVAALLKDPDINEAFTQADLELALEDRDWIGGLGGMASEKWTCDLQPQQRRLLIERSRMYWHRDPLAHQAVRLWTDYSFGDTGISYEGTQQSKIEGFMEDPRNRNYFSAQGQKRLSNRLLVDGDLFLAIFQDGTVRLFDTLQMTLITDPDDEDVVWGYQRKTSTNKKLYYNDWAYPEESLYDPETKRAAGKPGDAVEAESDCVMYRLSFDALGKWGNGLLNTSTVWSSSHRRFMQARVNLLEALSKIAYKLTVKGGPNAVANAKGKLDSTMVNGGTTNGVERNPPAISSSTYIGNAGADLQPMPRTTGAGDAAGDSNQLKLMVSAGTNIMLHYFGDPSTGNLATATAMELPMLKAFGAYQKLWIDAFKDIFSILLKIKPSQVKLDIALPNILEDDLQKLGTFLGTLTTVFPEAKTESILRECLISMNVADVDAVLKEVAVNRVKIDAQNTLNNQVAMAKAGMKGNGAPTTEPAPQAGMGADYTEAVAKLDAIGLSIAKLTELL